MKPCIRTHRGRTIGKNIGALSKIGSVLIGMVAYHAAVMDSP